MLTSSPFRPAALQMGTRLQKRMEARTRPASPMSMSTDPVSQVRPPRGNRATERASRVHEPQVGHPPRKPSSVRRRPRETRRTEPPQGSARNMGSGPLAAPARRSPRALKSGVPAAPGRMLAPRQARRYGRSALGGMWCRSWDGASSSHEPVLSDTASGSGGLDPVSIPDGVDADACIIYCR